MANNNLFGYTSSNNVKVNTSPFMAQQRVPTSGANQVAKAVTSIASSLGQIKQEKDKSSFIEASREANALKDKYVTDLSNTPDPYARAGLFAEYETNVNKLRDNYELPEEYQVRFDNANSNFLNSQRLTVNDNVRKQQIKDTTVNATEAIRAILDGKPEDVSSTMSNIVPALTSLGLDKNEASQLLFEQTAALLINGVTSANDVPMVKDKLKNIVDGFDKKLVGKDKYTKYMKALDKISQTQSKAMKNNIYELEHSDEYKLYQLEPRQYLSMLEANNDSLAKAKYKEYKNNFDKLDGYDPTLTHPNETELPDVAKKIALHTQQRLLSLGSDYTSNAFDIAITTEEYAPIKAKVTSIFTETDPETLKKEIQPFIKRYNKNPSAVLAVMGEKETLAFLWMKGLQENGMPITEATVQTLKEAKGSLTEVRLDPKVYEKIPKDLDYRKNIDMIKGFQFITNDSDKAYEMWKEQRDAFTTSKVDLYGREGGKGNYDDDYIDDISEVFLQAGKDLFPEGDDFRLVYKAETGTMWISSNGVPRADMGVTLEDMDAGYKIMKELEIKESTFENTKRNASNSIKRWFSAMYTRDAKTLGSFGDWFKKTFLVSGTELRREEMKKELQSRKTMNPFSDLESFGNIMTALEGDVEHKDIVNIKTTPYGINREVRQKEINDFAVSIGKSPESLSKEDYLQLSGNIMKSIDETRSKQSKDYRNLTEEQRFMVASAEYNTGTFYKGLVGALTEYNKEPSLDNLEKVVRQTTRTSKGKRIKGLDNRAVKELVFSGLINLKDPSHKKIIDKVLYKWSELSL